MELKIYKTQSGKFRWRLIDPSLKGTQAFIGSANQSFATEALCRSNALSVAAGLQKAVRGIKSAPAKAKKAPAKKAPAKENPATKKGGK